MVAWRVVAISVGLLIAFCGLALLFLKLDRPSDQISSSVDRPQVDRYLRRTDLLDGDRSPENPLEWVIVFSTMPKAQITVLLLAGIVTLTLAWTGYRGAMGVAFYFTLLALLALVMFYGWDRLEEGSNVAPPEDTRNPKLTEGAMTDSVRFRLQQSGHLDSDDRSRHLGLSDVKITVKVGTVLVVLVAVSVFALKF